MESTTRPACYRCHRPEIACICNTVVAVQNRTPVFVFQHPRERFHPLGTARLVRLGLERARVETLWPSAPGERPGYVPEGAALLYPSSDARELSTLSSRERPASLVVIDGTWHHARTLHRDIRWLRELPHVRLTPLDPSRYRIRREPRAECLSTLEAIVRALEILEPSTPGLGDLLISFDRMIDRQIELGVSRRKDPRKRLRRGTRGIPQAFIEHWDRLVVVYGESSLVESRDQERELVQWAAVRATTGETFEALLKPTRGLLRPWHLDHMGVSAEELERGLSIEAMGEAWRAFVRPDDVLVAWNQGILDLLLDTIGHDGPGLVLKSICRSVDRGGRGGIEDIVMRAGVEARPLSLRGRASERLGNALAIVRHLRGALG